MYNTKIEDIKSIDVFLSFVERHPEATLLVADNSTDTAILDSNSKCSLPIIYVPCGGNVGISKAYNLALGKIENSSFRVMLSDDDTLFSKEYMENMYAAATEEDNQDRLICGLIDTGKGWMSPRTIKTTNVAFPFMLRKPDVGVYSNRNPVNSGLCIPNRLIKIVGGYDERLFLDYVDYLFMDKLREKGYGEILLVPGKIIQEFSGFSDDISSSIKRWEIFRSDFTTYCELTHKSWFYKNYLLTRRSINIKLQTLLKGKKR